MHLHMYSYKDPFKFPYECLETNTLIRKLERILIKLDRQNMSLLFSQTCIN